MAGWEGIGPMAPTPFQQGRRLDTVGMLWVLDCIDQAPTSIRANVSGFRLAKALTGWC